MKQVAQLFGLLLLTGFASSAALAHKLAPSLLEITELPDMHYRIIWRTPLNAKIRPEPVFPHACTLHYPQTSQNGTALEWQWLMQCRQSLGGKSLEITSLAASRTGALVRYQPLNAPQYQQLLTSSAPRVTIPSKETHSGVLGQYFRYGVKHILVGIDHLFFVTGLLLLAGRWQTLLKTVTAFTLGHSITLAMVSLKLIPHWSSPIEVGIAATILILALELSRHRPKQATLFQRFQWPMAAVFGLVHGLGFAGVLSELGLPGDAIIPALLSFNLGIEAGQLLFVAAMATLLLTIRRHASSSLLIARGAVTYTMGTVAVYWCLDRGLSLLNELV